MLDFVESSLKMSLRELINKMQRRSVERTFYCGIPTMRCPNDTWVYQEIIWERKPDVIIEIGTYCGGLALALAHMLDNMFPACSVVDSNTGERLTMRCAHSGSEIFYKRVIAVDIDLTPARQHNPKPHERITFLEGSGVKLFPQIKAMISPEERVMVIEDSSHFTENTLAVLRTYEPLIKVGDYMIVEDTLVRHGLDEGPAAGHGPWEGIEKFLVENKNFVSDRSRENFILTWNPTGFLKRVS